MILIPACALSSLAFRMMYSAYGLNKQGDSMELFPWNTVFTLKNHWQPMGIQTWVLWRKFSQKSVKWAYHLYLLPVITVWAWRKKNETFGSLVSSVINLTTSHCFNYWDGSFYMSLLLILVHVIFNIIWNMWTFADLHIFPKWPIHDVKNQTWVKDPVKVQDTAMSGFVLWFFFLFRPVDLL